ncbi:MAG: hypothetical protein IJ583_13865 [Firmicutes bacterium]|nr:hypothetical protein [Bacillota bacterium]
MGIAGLLIAYDIANKNVAFLKSRITEKKEVINAIRTYWRLKPLYQQYKAIGNITDRELFKIRNGDDIRKYNTAVEIMNKSKLPDGSLPKAEVINAEILKLEVKKDDIITKHEKTKNKLQSYLIIKSNADMILNYSSDKNEITQEKIVTNDNKSVDISLF